MKHLVSEDDQIFRRDFEACKILPAEFNHRAHIRLAYVYLTAQDTEAAYESMRNALMSFIRHNGIDPSKYHDTITRAWILAVRHFMAITPSSDSSDHFINQNTKMLDPKIMLSHYSAEVLFSDEARARFVEPNLHPIPKHTS